MKVKVIFLLESLYFSIPKCVPNMKYIASKLKKKSDLVVCPLVDQFIQWNHENGLWPDGIDRGIQPWKYIHVRTCTCILQKPTKPLFRPYHQCHPSNTSHIQRPSCFNFNMSRVYAHCTYVYMYIRCMQSSTLFTCYPALQRLHLTNSLQVAFTTVTPI